MDLVNPTNITDSISEYLDAEGGSEDDYYHDTEPLQQQQEQEEEVNTYSIIHDICEELGTVTTAKQYNRNSSKVTSSSEFYSETTPTANSAVSLRSAESAIERESKLQSASTEDAVDFIQDSTWKRHKKHIFILSEAGKPVYSLHGNEDKLATLFGIIQTLVSFVQHGQDAITSIHAEGIKFVFLVRNSLTLVAASRSNMSVQQLQMQLGDVYNQILSTLTYSQMWKVFEKRKNFDLRRLLAGSERLIHHLLANDSSNKRVTNNVFTFLTNSICVLPLPSVVRQSITSAIQSNCAKIRDLVFAVLIANNKLIALVRMKKYFMHASDLRLIFNLIDCSESFKASESWTPICLPKFDKNGYLHAYVSYLTDDCPACLLLLSVDRGAFFALADAKKLIKEKLSRSHCLETLKTHLQSNEAPPTINLSTVGIPELRHFLYKPLRCTDSVQLLCGLLCPPYNALLEFERLESIYCELLHRMHYSARPLKLIYVEREREVVLAWTTAGYELYAVFEPLVERSAVIKYVDKLIKCIDKDFDVLFIRQHPAF